ncbi:MAG: hypothetical protein ACLPXB_14710, partial [Thiobacillaceae bacterium]
MKQLLIIILFIPALCHTVKHLKMAIKLSVLLAFAVAACTVSASEYFSLAGDWRFELDRADAGIQEQWFDRALADKIKLPGSLPAQGIGDDISTNTPW